MEKTTTEKKDLVKPPCSCVPSGQCCHYKVGGCPHNHYFDDKNQWVCGENPRNK